MSNTSVQLFLRACGATGPLRLGVEAGGEVAWKTCATPFAVVGRDGRADLAVEDPGVERSHAYLQLVAGRVLCLDLGSQAGVTWDGHRRGAGWVDRGQAIGVGPYRIKPYRIGPRDGVRDGYDDRVASADLPNPLGPESPAQDGLPNAALEFVNRKGGPMFWRIGRELTLVGSARDCKMRLIAPDISRFHCSLLRTQIGVWAVDLLGQVGIRVNGADVRFARLDDGDELRIGPFLLRLRYGEATATPGTPTSSRRPPVSRAGREGGVVPRRPAPSRPLLPAAMTAMTLQPASVRPSSGTATAARPVVRPVPVPTQAQLIESMVVPLMDQFGQLQQHMFDEFHRAMWTMMEMFDSMQKESAGQVREQLSRLDQLTLELESLKAEQARRLTSPPARPVALPGPSGPSPSLTVPVALASEARTSSWPAPGAPHSRMAARPNPPLAGPSEDEFHSRLIRRIAEIHGERQGLWQGVIGFLKAHGLAPAIS